MGRFSRHIYRDSKYMFKNDKKILFFMEMALDHYIEAYNADEKVFVLMPYCQIENIENQILGIQILENLIKKEKLQKEKNILKKALYHHKGHLKILQKFSRFPKRNNILERVSTEEEIDYLDNYINFPY